MCDEVECPNCGDILEHGETWLCINCDLTEGERDEDGDVPGRAR